MAVACFSGSGMLQWLWHAFRLACSPNACERCKCKLRQTARAPPATRILAVAYSKARAQSPMCVLDSGLWLEKVTTV
eukprot:1152353-Pelagomonas_calceolata.AAC.2